MARGGMSGAARATVAGAAAASAAMELTPAAPLRRRMAAWANERFPLAGTAAMLLSLYFAALVYGRALAHEGAIEVSSGDLGAFFAVWGFFLMIRVLDEHKDYERDRVAHPDRVLQRGLVTLGQLRVLGAAAVAVQLAVSLLADGGVGAVTLWWLALIGFVALTAREFFVGEWLEGRLLLYVLAHLPLWSLAVTWMVQMGARPSSLPASAAWAAVLGFLLPWGADLARRIAPSELQGPGATSYADSLGAGRAAALLGGTLIGGGAAAAAMLRAAGEHSAVPVIFLTALLVPAVAALWRFRRDPHGRSANRMLQATARAVLLAELLVVVVALLADRGLRWAA
ncbi:MAG TPA: hypothetical protein VF517_06925 [Thermoleophilaceae bacterium]